MEICQFGFSEFPDDLESDLILFIANSGSFPAGTSPIFPMAPDKERAIEANRDFLIGRGYQEMGALKDDVLIQVAKGQIKTNYGNSRKRECNFTLVYARGGTQPGDNINNTLASDGCTVDVVVIDQANCLLYRLTDLELETGVKIQHKKFTELPIKATGDGFSRPLQVHNIIGRSLIINQEIKS